jgi:hypothetical protein
MKTIGKGIRAAHVEHRSWKQEMFSFLRTYRATPHATTNATPAELLLGRALNSCVPEILPSSPNKKVSNYDGKQKQKMKIYADNKRKAKHINLPIGDQILVKQQKRDKLTTPYHPKSFQIVEQHGSMIAEKSDEKEITRDASFYKKINIESQQTGETSNDPMEINPAQQEPRRSARQCRPSSYLKGYACD